MRQMIAVSGGFDPVHIGHIRMIQEAAKYGSVLVILNNDNWLMKKKGYVFMPQKERKEILESIRGVSKVVITRHDKKCRDRSVAADLKRYKPRCFANGGDRKKKNAESKEVKICKKLGITMIYNVGGRKIQSSSWLVKNGHK